MDARDLGIWLAAIGAVMRALRPLFQRLLARIDARARMRAVEGLIDAGVKPREAMKIVDQMMPTDATASDDKETER